MLLVVAALGTLLLVLRAVLTHDEPWWVSWTAPVGAAVLTAAAATGFPAVVTAVALGVLVVGLVLQVVQSYRGGRYLEDDVATLWRRVRRRPDPQRRRHRARAD